MKPQSDEWLRLVVNWLPQYLWTSDADGTPTYVDPRLHALLGVDGPNSAPQGWFDRVHPEDQQAAIETWRNAVLSGREFGVEYRLQVEDGSYRWFVTRGRPALREDKSVCYWVGSIDDIHEIVQTRFQLHAEQVRLAKTADASPQMLFSFRHGPDGRPSFPYVSPAMERTFGVKGEVLAVDVSSFFMLGHPEDTAGIIASVEMSKQQMALWTHQWRVRALERGEIWLEAHSMPVRDADGGTTWHGTVSDVTARRQHEDVIGKLNADLELRVTQRTEELELANHELEAFSYSVSHDLREPLRAVNGFAQALVEDYAAQLPSGAQHYLDAIRQGGLRMGRLIDDLLAFSRLSRQPLRRRSIDVALLVESCLKDLTLTEGGRATIKVGPLLPCEADPALIRQVFVNLLGNAFKYSRKREAPCIEVTSQHDPEGRVVYVVKDNGTGFNMKYAHKLFQVFQRLHPREDFEGTGVGLAIVQRIVSRHGGRVWVDAAPDVGATFSFTLEA